MSTWQKLCVCSLLFIVSTVSQLDCRDAYDLAANGATEITTPEDISTFSSNYLIVNIKSSSGPHIRLKKDQSTANYFEIIFDWEFSGDHRFEIRHQYSGSYDLLQANLAVTDILNTVFTTFWIDWNVNGLIRVGTGSTVAQNIQLSVTYTTVYPNKDAITAIQLYAYQFPAEYRFWTECPTATPTKNPTLIPSRNPTVSPTNNPTQVGNVYIKNAQLLNFEDNDALCSFLYDSYLGAIHNSIENVFASEKCNTGSCYIGLNDAYVKGYAWTDQSLFDYGYNITGGVLPWDINQPNSGDCTVISGSLWSSVSCDSLYIGLCNNPSKVLVTDDMTLVPLSEVVNIGNMDILDEIYIEFDISISSFNKSLTMPSQIIKIGNNDNESYPLITVDHISETIQIQFSAVSDVSRNIGTAQTLSPLQTYNIQFLASQNSIVWLMDNITVFEQGSSAESHSILMNRNIYIGNEYVSVSGINVETSNTFDINNTGFNYLCDYNNRFTETSGVWVYDPIACTLLQTEAPTSHLGINNKMIWLGDIDPGSIHWQNYKIEAVIRFNVNGRAGIMFRTQKITYSTTSTQGNDFYHVFIQHFTLESNQRIVLSRYINGASTKLKEKVTPIAQQTDYKLRVQVNAMYFDVYLNNVFFFRCNDTTYDYGSIGIFTRHDSILIKSLRITFPTDTSLLTLNPTSSPTKIPTISPTGNPTKSPTKNPTTFPTENPTTSPTKNPTKFPTQNPTPVPTIAPSIAPSSAPTPAPTGDPTTSPTRAPFVPGDPTQSPSMPTTVPTKYPTKYPTQSPTKYPSKYPTKNPTQYPTKSPTKNPTNNPTKSPTKNPSKYPTKNPTKYPTKSPTKSPTNNPTQNPTQSPTKYPAKSPTNNPTDSPSKTPTNDPSISPTHYPVKTPTIFPTINPTQSPTNNPTLLEVTINPTKSASVTTDYKVVIIVDNCDNNQKTHSNANELSQQILDALDECECQEIVITETECTYDDTLVVKLSITTDPNQILQEDVIKGAIEQEIEDDDRFGDVDVSVSDTFVTTSNSKELNALNASFIEENMMLLIAILGGLMVIICGLIFYFCLRKKNKKNGNKMNAHSDTMELTRVTSLSNEGAKTNTTMHIIPQSPQSTNDGNTTNDALRKWLNSIELIEYYELFIEQGFGVQLSMFDELNDSDLVTLGIMKMADRKLILKEIYSLKNIVNGENGPGTNRDNEDDLYSKPLITAQKITGGTNDDDSNNDMYSEPFVHTLGNDDIITKGISQIISNEENDNVSDEELDRMYDNGHRVATIGSDMQEQKKGFYVFGVSEYIATEDDQLNVKENDVFYIMECIESGWWFGYEENGKDGWVPSNYLRKCNIQEQKQLEKQQKLQTDIGHLMESSKTDKYLKTKLPSKIIL